MSNAINHESGMLSRAYKLAILIAVLSAITVFPQNEAYANNHGDEPFAYDSIQHGWEYYTSPSAKTDSSYVYVKAHVAAGTTAVRPMAQDGWGKLHDAQAQTAYFSTPATVFLSNYVHELGYPLALLQMTYTTGTQTSNICELYGVWSPDSIDANGNPYL